MLLDADKKAKAGLAKASTAFGDTILHFCASVASEDDFSDQTAHMVQMLINAGSLHGHSKFKTSNPKPDQKKLYRTGILQS